MNFCKFTYRAIVLVSFMTSLSVSNVFAQNTGVINGNNINVRLYADSERNSVLTTVNRGKPIEIQGLEDGFYKVSFDDINEVYISDKYVNLENVDGFVANADTYVNIRQLPSLDSQIVGQAKAGEKIQVTYKVDDWYKIDYSSEEAFIHKDFVDGELLPYVSSLEIDEFLPYSNYNEDLIVESNDMYIIVNSDDGINLRSEPSEFSDVLAVLPNRKTADYIESQGEWVKVSYNNTIGFVNSNYIYIESGEIPVSNNYLADEIIEYGKQFLGTPYVYGGTNLNSGVDCSGFVYSVMQHFNINLSRSSREQVHNGSTIQKSQLQKGDLVFFDTNGGANRGNISHVGIYIENNQFIHSSSSKNGWGVTISSLNEDYYIRTYVTAARVL